MSRPRDKFALAPTLTVDLIATVVNVVNSLVDAIARPTNCLAGGDDVGHAFAPAPPRAGTMDCRAGARIDDAMTVQLTAAVTHEGNWYVARCLQVEVTSQGETVEQALDNLREALELYFEDEPLPADVQAPIIAPVEISVRAA